MARKTPPDRTRRLRKLRNLHGKVFTDLTVKGKGPKDDNYHTWICLCACGQTVTYLHHELTLDKAKDCGCKLGVIPWGANFVHQIKRKLRDKENANAKHTTTI